MFALLCATFIVAQFLSLAGDRKSGADNEGGKDLLDVHGHLHPSGGADSARGRTVALRTKGMGQRGGRHQRAYITPTFFLFASTHPALKLSYHRLTLSVRVCLSDFDSFIAYESFVRLFVCGS
jgi:hypothetical protein